MRSEDLYIHTYPDGRMDAVNAATYLGLSVKTLAMKRSDGTGPAFIKRGRVFYYQSDLDAWLQEQGKMLSAKQAKLANKKS